MSVLNDKDTLEKFVRQAVAEVTISDVHTHLFPPAHGELLLWGVDELLTYHYLVAELFTVAPRDVMPEVFWKLGKSQQADLIWRHVFLEHGPLSEAARGVITTLSALGLDPASRDLEAARKWFAEQNVEEYLEKVFDLAGLDYAVMTNNPFIAAEADAWKRQLPRPQRLKAALRIDTLVLDWPVAAKHMKAQGYKTPEPLAKTSIREARRFLTDWIQRISPVYLAASLPNDFAYPSDDASTMVLREIVLPVAIESKIPLAMMIGVRKQINPALGDGGDGVGVCDIEAVQHLCQEFSDAKFLVTVLSRVNQHELCVLARKFGHLHVFGCWWFNNNPSIIDEITRMRLELLGTAFTAQHSDARVLDQLIYKWSHTRKIVADILADKYRDLFEAGWRPSEQEIRRDVRAIFGGSFEQFLAK